MPAKAIPPENQLRADGMGFAFPKNSVPPQPAGGTIEVKLGRYSFSTDMKGIEKTGYLAAILGGLCGALFLLLLLLFWISRTMYWTSINIPSLIGSFFTGEYSPLTWLLGFALLLALSMAVSLIYALSFHQTKLSGPIVGLAFGFIHWAAQGIIAGYIGRVHPLAPDILSPPGYFISNYGWSSIMIFLIAHLMFGALVGFIHLQAVKRKNPTSSN